MATYKYLLPIVSVAPFGELGMTFSVPLEKIRGMLTGKVEALRIEQQLIRDAAVLERQEVTIDVRGGPVDPVFYLNQKSLIPSQDWREGQSVAFIETYISAIGGGGFAGHFCPSTYTIYSGRQCKTILSDNSLKFGDYNVITQVRAFKRWIAGYPLVEIDHARDVEESFILINPFERPAVAAITAPQAQRRIKLRIPARSGSRVALGKGFGLTEEAWRGQVYVTGPNRLIVFDCKHSLQNPCDVNVLEHLDLFRGDDATEPMTQALRRSVGDMLRMRKH